jgi:ankyrin repeat protein
MTDITFPPGEIVDDATRKRTEAFFDGLIMDTLDKKLATDKELTSLVQQGICLEARSINKFTPLIIALMKNKSLAVKALLAAGANIEVSGNGGKAPLFYAANSRDTLCLQLLLAAKADTEKYNDDGDTPLLHACLYLNRYVVEALINNGADIEARNKEGAPTLILVCKLRARSLIPLLLDKGANIYARDNDGNKADYNEIGHRLIDRLQHQYAAFKAHGTAPTTARQIYELLSATPLANPQVPVDYAGNLERIFTHAKWKNKEQAEAVLGEIQKHGRITAETAESIFAAAFPRARAHSMLQAQAGRGR